MPRDAYPRDVLLLANRLQAISDEAKNIAAHLLDLYLLAHEKPTGDKIRSSRPEGYTQTTANPRALNLWRALNGKHLDSVKGIDDLLNGWCSDLRAVFAGDHHGGARPGRPIPQAELDDAIAMQKKRRARGDYTPTRQVAQLEEVPKR
jgi:hypothetical protein